MAGGNTGCLGFELYGVQRFIFGLTFNPFFIPEMSEVAATYATYVEMKKDSQRWRDLPDGFLVPPGKLLQLYFLTATGFWILGYIFGSNVKK